MPNLSGHRPYATVTTIRRICSRFAAAGRGTCSGPWILPRLTKLNPSVFFIVSVAAIGLYQAQDEWTKTWRRFLVLKTDSADASGNDASAESISILGSRYRYTQSTRSIETNDRLESQGKPPLPAHTFGIKDGALSKEHDRDGSESLWTIASRLAEANLSTISDKIRDAVFPDWIRLIPGLVGKLQNELSMAPGSLAEEIWDEACDADLNPEIIRDCQVRVSNELCEEEKAFLGVRKLRTTKALAHYLDIPEETIHPDDVPIISMCGSGGGLRALVAGASSYLSAKDAGLFDCITYTAGVSGSCWMQTLFYSSIGQQNHRTLIKHLKNRLGVHIAYPPAALKLATYAPTNKFLLRGLVEKFKGVPDADFGIVDLYGLLLAARLLIPKGDLAINDADLKLSNQKNLVDGGAFPLPIYTAVRHEIPLEQLQTTTIDEAREKAREESWFQWFEFTPYEFWCEELHAGIPTWAIGRSFQNGSTETGANGLVLPELRTPLLMGIWGSAFCATLSHYYKEIQPLVKTISGLGGIDALISERDDDLIKVHPIDPATIPNFAIGMQSQLPDSTPRSIFQTRHFQLMDAGMSNNLPIYPLLRPGRNVDIIIAFDSSADVKKDNWLRICDGYARQRGIKGWPIGAGWPPATGTVEQAAADLDRAQASSPTEASERLQNVARDSHMNTADDQTPQSARHAAGDLSYCNVWIGTTEERKSENEPPASKLVSEDWQLMSPDAGICVVYFPLLANDKVANVDPKSSDFLSTWNFVYTPEQIDKVVSLARTNFEEGEEQVKMTVRAVYERKKQQRLEREQAGLEMQEERKMSTGLSLREFGQGDHADQFT